jgi:hypothetical protein
MINFNDAYSRRGKGRHTEEKCSLCTCIQEGFADIVPGTLEQRVRNITTIAQRT